MAALAHIAERGSGGRARETGTPPGSSDGDLESSSLALPSVRHFRTCLPVPGPRHAEPPGPEIPGRCHRRRTRSGPPSELPGRAEPTPRHPYRAKSTAATTCARLEHHRISDRRGSLLSLLQGVHWPVRSGKDGKPAALILPSRNLSANCSIALGRRTNEDNATLLAHLREVCVL